MTEETIRLITSLKSKTSTIKNELIKLKEENEILRKKLSEEQDASVERNLMISEMKDKYETLKIAKSLNNDSDNEALKKRINAMVREIDTCIELIEQ